MPTGGVTPEEDNLRKWFDAGVACVGMGSNLIKKEWLDAGNFEAVQQLTSTILERIQVIRTR
jgi:2-dehydro-3-deoxyphosphogluconate aldolase/(4S)-4-hydroxy-2-oxoglutarate aldolase